MLGLLGGGEVVSFDIVFLKKTQIIAYLLSRPHGATSLQEGFCNLEVDEDSGSSENAQTS